MKVWEYIEQVERHLAELKTLDPMLPVEKMTVDRCSDDATIECHFEEVTGLGLYLADADGVETEIVQDGSSVVVTLYG